MLVGIMYGDFYRSRPTCCLNMESNLATGEISCSLYKWYLPIVDLSENYFDKCKVHETTNTRSSLICNDLGFVS